jgi:hypothetical protein
MPCGNFLCVTCYNLIGFYIVHIDQLTCLIFIMIKLFEMVIKINKSLISYVVKA